MTAHLFIVHFPISLVVLAAVLDLLGVGMGDRRLRHAAWILLLVGAVAGFLAFATGEGAKLVALASMNVRMDHLETHQQWGSVGIWGLIGGALVRTLWRNRLTGAHGMLNLGLVFVLAGMVVMMTVSGTMIRHSG
jgi:uncharacterized membrane protein